jgi:hypothetical protein
MNLYDCQTALKAHLATEFKKPDVRTIDILAGELEEDAISDTVVLPAIFVMFRSGALNPDRSSYEFPIVVATESMSLDKKTSQRNNLELAANVADFLLQNPIFASTEGGAYQISPDMQAGLYALNDRHCVIVLHPQISDNSQ